MGGAAQSHGTQATRVLAATFGGGPLQFLPFSLEEAVIAAQTSAVCPGAGGQGWRLAQESAAGK